MKLIFKMFFGMLLLSSFTINNEKDNDIQGVWLMANKNVKVEIFRSNDLYLGKVIWMGADADKRNFKLGDIIIDDMQYNPTNRKYEGGSFYGRGYKLDCELKLVEKDRIEVRVSMGILHKTRYCTRVN